MSKLNKEANMDRGLRRKKSERARARRKNVKEIKESTLARMYRRLKEKRIKLSKLKRKHHDKR
jgi:6-phosphogluconate dehydrogenase